MEITKKVIEETAQELLEESDSASTARAIEEFRDLLLQRKDEATRDF